MVAGIIASLVSDGTDAASPTVIDATETVAAPPLATEPPAPEPGFGDGVFRVGGDIQPGTYRTAGGSDCYWERLSGLTGDFDDLLANDNPDGQAYAEILPTDVAFSTENCGRWMPDSAGGPDVSGGFSDGVFRVGSDIQPGTYRTAGGSDCYWERLSGLTGDFDDLLANDNPDGQAYVEILPTDVAFSTEDCGTWSRTE